MLRSMVFFVSIWWCRGRNEGPEQRSARRNGSVLGNDAWNHGAGKMWGFLTVLTASVSSFAIAFNSLRPSDENKFPIENGSQSNETYTHFAFGNGILFFAV